MDTDSFIVYIKTDDIYKDIAEDVNARFGTWFDVKNVGARAYSFLVIDYTLASDNP